MLARIGRLAVRENRRLLAAYMSSQGPRPVPAGNRPASATAASPPAAPTLNGVDIQDAVAASNVDIQDAVAAAAAQYKGVIIQGFQGDPVDGFSPVWAKDVMDHAMSAGRETLQERMENRQQGVQGDIEPPVGNETKTTRN